MNRKMKIALYAVGSVSALFAIGIFSSIAFLKSPTGSAWLAKKIESQLAEKMNLHLTYSHLGFSPFSYIKIKDLVLKKETSTETLDGQIAELNIEYDFSIFSRSLNVERFEIVKPTFKFKLTPATADAPSQPAPSPKDVKSDPHRAPFEWPDVRVVIKTLAVDHLKIQGTLERLDDRSGDRLGGRPGDQATAHEKTEINLPEISIQSRFSYRPKNIDLTGSLHLASGATLKVDGPHTKLTLNPQADITAKILFEAENKIANLTVEPSQLNFSLKNFEFLQTTSQKNSKNESTFFKLQDLTIVSEVQVLAHFDESFNFSPANQIDKLAIKGDLVSKAAQWKLTQKEKTSTGEFGSQHLSLKSLSEKQTTYQLVHQLTGLKMPGILLKPAQLESTLSGSLSNKLDSLSADFKSTFNQTDWMSSHIQAQYPGKADLSVDVNLARVLATQIQALAFLENTSDLKVTSNISVELPENFNAEKMHHLKFETKTAQILGKNKVAIHFDPIHLQGTMIQNSSTQLTSFTLAGQAPKISTAQATSPFDIEATAIAEFNLAKETGEFRPHIKIKNNEIGVLDTKSEFKLGLGATQMTVEGKSLITQAALPQTKTQGFEVILKDPVTINQSHRLLNLHLTSNFELVIPSFEVAKMAVVKDTQLKSSVEIPNLSQLQNILVKVSLRQGALALEKQYLNTPFPLSGLKGSMDITLADTNHFAIDNFFLDFNQSMLKMSSSLNGKIASKDIQGDGLFSFRIPKTFPGIAGKQVSGTLEFPFNFSVLKGQQIQWDGDITLVDLFFNNPEKKIKIEGISGSIPLQEKLKFDGTSLSFAYLLNQNPFERVDYERVRPLLNDAKPVTIKSVTVEEKTYGPMTGYFSIRQNILSAHRFDLAMGTNGKAWGEMLLNVHPDFRQFAILSRLTGLDLDEVLPNRYLLRAPKGKKIISGRMGLLFNLNQGSIDGRMDITEVGGQQLVTLISLLDPLYEDENMNRMRTALGLGYPTEVEMAFQKGYLDLGVQMIVLGVNKRFDVRGIPIFGWISSSTADLKKITSEVPLK